MLGVCAINNKCTIHVVSSGESEFIVCAFYAPAYSTIQDSHMWRVKPISNIFHNKEQAESFREGIMQFCKSAPMTIIGNRYI
jgi:hypothetical protein